MPTVTRKQYQNMPEKLGGDLWNQYKLCAIAFHKFPDAVQIDYSLGTGLWCYIDYETANGEKKQGTIYESDEWPPSPKKD